MTRTGYESFFIPSGMLVGVSSAHGPPEKRLLLINRNYSLLVRTIHEKAIFNTSIAVCFSNVVHRLQKRRCCTHQDHKCIFAHNAGN